MLRYIHQFVQTFLKEASKSRPKSRKSSRSSVDLAKEKSTVKPEILAIDFNNEGPEAERSKEIMELKRTYSFLMKKFVNPKLDLMSSTKAPIETNVLNLKGKQELIKSALNKIFYENTEQHKQLENSTEVTVKDKEESSVGWSGQRTSKLAANPMVETSSKSKSIASALTSFPENKVKTPKKTVRQSDKYFKDETTSVNVKDLSVKSKYQNNIKPKNVVDSNLRKYEFSEDIKPHKYIVKGANRNKNIRKEKETMSEYKEDKNYPQKIEKLVTPKGNSRETLQSPLKLKLNNDSEVKGSLSKQHKYKKDEALYNQKENKKTIKRTSKVDNSKAAKADENNNNAKVSTNTKFGEKKSTPNKIKKEQKAVTNLKAPVHQEVFDAEVIKNNGLPNENEKTKQIACAVINHEELLINTVPSALKPSQDNDNIFNTPQKEENTHNKIESNILKSSTEQENSDQVEEMAIGKYLTQQNVRTLEVEQNQVACIKPKITECVSRDQPPNPDQAGKSDDKTLNIAVNKNPKSDDSTYWNFLSNKLLETSNDVKKLINNFEASNWKTTSISTTQELAKDVLESDKNEKQDEVETQVVYETSKPNDQKFSDYLDVKADTYVNQVDATGKETANTQTSKNIIPENDKKIKTLLRRFKKTEKHKSKQTVGTGLAIYGKHVKEGKLNRKSLYKFPMNKDKPKVNKVERAKRNKSSQFVVNNNLISFQGAGETLLPPKVVSITNTPRNIPTKALNEPEKKEKIINHLDSNTIPRKRYDTEKKDIKGTDQPNSSKLARESFNETDKKASHHSSTKNKRELDLTKPRKLHSRKHFSKPVNKLQMYGSRRSIYTYSNSNAPGSLVKSCNSGNISEPNLASRSLLNICGLAPNKETNLFPRTTQVRNIHTSGSRGKAKQPRRKRTTVINRNSKTKPENVDSAKCHVSNDTTGINLKVIELKSETSQSGITNLPAVCPNNLPSETLSRKMSLVNGENQNCEAKTEITVSDNNYPLRSTSNTPSQSGSIKVKNDESAIPLSKYSESKGCLIPNSELKEGNLIDSHSRSGIKEIDDMGIEKSELKLNMDLQSAEPPQRYEALIDSPKWRSKQDRLEKWKSEVTCNTSESRKKDVGIKSNENPGNISSHTQSKENMGKSNKVLGKAEMKKDVKVDHNARSNISVNLKSAKDNVDKINLQKDDKTSVVCCDLEKTNIEKGNHKFGKDSVKSSSLDANITCPIQNKTEKISITNADSKISNLGNENTTSNNKIKKFELKLKNLESKLKALELKSVEQKHTEYLSKSNMKKGSEGLSNDITDDKNKIDGKREIKTSQLVGTNNELNKNKIAISSLPVKSESKIIKKDPNDLIKEHLSQKVKSLELKLKSLEIKVRDIKEKSNDSATIKQVSCNVSPMCKKDSVQTNIQNLTKPNHDLVKPNEKVNQLLSNKIINLKIPNNTQIENKNKEKIEKPIIVSEPVSYLKHNLSLDKNNIRDQIKSAENMLKHPDKTKSSKATNELKYENKIATNVEVAGGKIHKQKLQFVHTSCLESGDTKKPILKDNNKSNSEQTVGPKKDTVYTLNTTVLPKDSKETNDLSKVVLKHIDQKRLRPLSALDSKLLTNLKTQKEKPLSKPTASTILPLVQMDSSEAAVKSTTYRSKCCNNSDDAEQKKIPTSTKKSLKKSVIYNFSKKKFLKGSQHKRLKKGLVEDKVKVDSSFMVKDFLGRKRDKSPMLLKKLSKTLHLSKSPHKKQNFGDKKVEIKSYVGSTSSRKSLKPPKSNKCNLPVEDKVKVESSFLAKDPSSRIREKSPVLPKKLSETLNLLKSPRKKQNFDSNKVAVRSVLDSTSSSKSLKDNISSDKKVSNSKKEEIKKFNSFDYYRPRRRTYDVKHPIEKEKYGLEYHRRNENILDTLHPKYMLQNYKMNNNRREATEVHSVNDKCLDTLVLQNCPNKVKSVHK